MARKPLIEPGSILPAETMLGRIVARDREKAGRRETETADSAAEPQSGEPQEDGHMTGHITNNMTNQQSNKPDNKHTGQLGSNITGKAYGSLTHEVKGPVDSEPVSRDSGQEDARTVPDKRRQAPRASAKGNPVTQVRQSAADAAPDGVGGVAETASLAESIRASLRTPAAEPALKTVTLKMSPALDRKIEDHCYQTGRKKQDVIRDAVLLYFETIETLGDD